MPEEEKTRGGGPKTPEGKARSSQNSIKHGARAKHVLVLEDESVDDYTRDFNGWLEEFPPRTFAEEQLVKQLILNSWLMKRATRRAMELEGTAAVAAADWTADDEHKLQLMQRYKTTAERAFYRSLAAVRHLGKDILKNELAILKLTGEVARLQGQLASQTEELEALRPVPAPEEKAAAHEKSARGMDGKPKKKEKLAVLEQWVEIRQNEAGETVTELFPSNEELQKAVAKKKRLPDLVYRRLFFVGVVPAEYGWTTDQERAYGGLGTQRLTWATWQAQIGRERMTEGGHLLPTTNLPRPQERGGCECRVCQGNEGMLRAAGLE